MRRVAVVLAALFLAAACGGGNSGSSSTSDQPRAGGTVTLALDSELRIVDPMESSLLVEREVFYNLYDALFTIDTSLKIQPGLVTKWDVSDSKN